MNNVLLSADLVYLDIAFFVIVALFLLVGIFRGIAKSFKGFFLAVTIILCAILLIGVTFEPVSKIAVFDSIDTKIEEKLSTSDAVFSEPIYYNEAEGYFYIYSPDVKLSEYNGLKGRFANWLCERFMKPDMYGTSIASIGSGMITSVIIFAIAFIVYCIALGIICAIIRKITGGMHTSESSVAKLFDRLIGAIISAALGFVFLLVVLAILKSINIGVVTDFINGSTVCKYFFDNNPISQVFAKIFGA